MKVVTVHSPQERAALLSAAALPAFDAGQIAAHAADAHLCALAASGEIRAHCSLWWKDAPLLGAHRVGAIGHYAGVDGDAAAAVLDAALRSLRQNGCTLAVGPMDGNTWRRYRFVTDAGPSSRPEPPFFMEPTNPAEWPSQFESAGFAPLAAYFSALNSDLDQPDERLAPIEKRLDSIGVSVRSARQVELHDELRRIYEVSCVAFTRNFLYTELPEAAFIAQYTALLDRIRPELVLLAERGSDLVGYAFAIPDFAQAARGASIDTFIIKTVAILPEPALRGLGSLLVARAQQAGRELGFRRAIHALMHEDNVSRNISRRYAATMRRYTLFSRELAP
jgi:GNAT superfamily N-acetyltransferase